MGEVDCPECGGTGYIVCEGCDGSGKVDEDDEHELRVEYFMRLIGGKE